MNLPRRYCLCLLYVVLAAGYLSLRPYMAQTRESPRNSASQPLRSRSNWAQNTLSRLSLEEKVGQMLQVRYYADYQSFESAEYRDLRDQIRKYHIGSVVFGMHFNGSGAIRATPLRAAQIANQLQTESYLPLLFAADLERGAASRLTDVPAFPWPMAWGAVDDIELVERFGAVTAAEARAVGIQWVLAPVADVNSNPANPVINDRSFGEDSRLVGDLVSAYIRGAHTKGVLVTAKHFPGHGDSTLDSHRAVPSIEGDKDHLDRIELPPFRRAIAAGTDSIMLAHARVPAIDPESSHIATTSYEVVTKTLKKDLGFSGVVLTDALEMKGITSLYDPRQGSPTARAAVDAVKAGCDVIMIPTDLDGAFHAIIDAVRGGEIPKPQIDESVRKILDMKSAVGLEKNRYVDLDHVAERVNSSEYVVFAQNVADQAVTLVKNNGHLLPFQSAKMRAYATAALPDDSVRPSMTVVIISDDLGTTNGREFEREIISRRPGARVFYVDNRTANAGGIQVLDAVMKSDSVVVAAYIAHTAAHSGVIDGKTLTFYGLRGSSGVLLEKILGAVPEKTAVVALGSPYLISSFPQIQTYLCTYAAASTSEISAVKAIFGEIENHAKLPITLPGIASRGFSLPWPTKAPVRINQFSMMLPVVGTPR